MATQVGSVFKPRSAQNHEWLRELNESLRLLNEQLKTAQMEEESDYTKQLHSTNITVLKAIELAAAKDFQKAVPSFDERLRHHL